MAKLIPTRSSCLPRMTSGEKRLSDRLEQKLEDDYLCWFDVPIGPKQLHPDFVIAHPRRGFLVLEVKDWKLDTIKSMDRKSVSLLTDRGLISVFNPLNQARVYALEVAVTLEKDPALRQSANTTHANKLVMPYGWGVVLTNITRKQFDANGFAEVLEPHLVICQDEMTESVDAADFQKRLWDMFRQVFPCNLTLPQIDRVRWHLFPELRVSPKQGQFGLFDQADGKSAALDIPDMIRIMDLQQEQLARSLGDGHRIIHGVAGSGKTMILGYRCLRMAQAMSKPILVLCYNVTLAARLRQLIEGHGLSERITVRSFHAWCREMLKTYHLEIPSGRGVFDRMISNVISGVDRGQIPRAQYGALLIDEGHDFEPEWFKLIVQMVDPSTNSLLVLYDDAQAIYSKGEKKKFSFASVGIQAQGRTTILKLNYRNTVEILSVARAFADELLTAKDAEDDGVPLLAPESAGRRGSLPELVRCDSLQNEAKLIAERCRDERNQGRSLSDMAIIYRSTRLADEVEKQLTRQGLPFRSTTANDGKKTLFEGDDAIKVVTMHSSKGLEFGTVFIPGLGYEPDDAGTESDEARLVYVAMTRATQKLVMTYHQESALSSKMGSVLGKVRQSLPEHT